MAPTVDTVSGVTLGTGSLTIVVIVGIVALAALAVGAVFRRQVLALSLIHI